MLDASQTRLRYNQTATHYHARYSEIQRTKYPILLDLLAVASCQKILDWGCGSCLAFQAIAAAGAKYVGLDFSPGMLSAREGRAERCVVVGDCTRLPFRSASFDGLLGATVIQNVPRRAAALSEISRVLKDGGMAALSFPKKTNVRLRGLRAAGLRVLRRIPCNEDIAICLQKRSE